MDTDVTTLVKRLTRELDNFRDIAKYILPTPGDVPRLSGIDLFGGTLPLGGSAGGDHIIYVDFKRRYDLDARIARAQADGSWAWTWLSRLSFGVCTAYAAAKARATT